MGATRTDRPAAIPIGAVRKPTPIGRAPTREGRRNRAPARPRAGRPDGAYGQTGRPNGAYTQANRAPYGRQGAGQRPAAGAPAYNRSRSQANRNRTAGGTEYSDYSRYIDQRQKRRRKSPLAIVVSLVILAAIGVGVYFFLNPLSFEVTVNGVKHTVDRGATLGTTLEEGMASPQPGNLLAIDGTVATEGGGDKLSATVNGEATNDEKRELKKGDVIEIANGSDTTETFQSSTEEVPFTRVEDENYWNGSLHVYIPGVNGVRTTKTGDVSGITTRRGHAARGQRGIQDIQRQRGRRQGDRAHVRRRPLAGFRTAESSTSWTSTTPRRRSSPSATR